MPHDPQFLATAVEAVLHAGEMQMAHFGTDFRISKKGDIDLVTEVDLSVERWFRGMIAGRFPDHHVLAEELGDASAPRDGSHCWIFDPIDGTTNYAHGLPIFCASLALEIDGTVVVGAVYDPTRRELFTAERRLGAFLNGSPLVVSTTTALVNALLVTGFPYNVHIAGDDMLGLFGAFIKRARAVRRLGSAALYLCYVAAGRMDGFWEPLLKPWDVAAGALIVEESGGRVSGFHGEPFSSHDGQIVASNGSLHAQMVETIAGFAATRSRNRTD